MPSLMQKAEAWVRKRIALASVVASVGVVAAILLLRKKLLERSLRLPLGVDERTFDYIVVGAGSAGAVMASRLSEDPSVTVLLLEAGGNDAGNRDIDIPVAATRLQGVETDWQFKTTPQPHTEFRVHKWPRGRVLGGCSSINWMLYVRGHPVDYDNWADWGCEGWEYEKVLPYFKKSEGFVGCTKEESKYHGKNGPWLISSFDPKHPQAKSTNELSRTWVKAAGEAGISYTPDYNGAEMFGAGFSQVNIANGVRQNTSMVFLQPHLRRSNLTVKTGAHVQKVLMDHTRAAGVVYVDTNVPDEAITYAVRARKEVILCGGAVQSPQLLMLSGIGPARHLQEQQIRVIHDLPGVGENMQDHIMVGITNKCQKPVTYDAGNMERLHLLVQWLIFKSGRLTTQGLEAMAFIKTKEHERRPDCQLHFVCAGAGHDKVSTNMNIFKLEALGIDYGITTLPTLLHPKSKGTIRLQSNDPMAEPVIDPHYLEHPDDLEVLVQGVKTARKIHKAKHFERYGLTELVDAGLAEQFDPESDDYIRAYIRKYVITVYHPVGTCKMGKDSDAVVDSRGRVIGIRNLRIADCSIMPDLPSANTNAPAVMVGEYVADMIKQDWASGNGGQPGGPVVTKARF